MKSTSRRASGVAMMGLFVIKASAALALEQKGTEAVRAIPEQTVPTVNTMPSILTYTNHAWPRLFSRERASTLDASTRQEQQAWRVRARRCLEEVDATIGNWGPTSMHGRWTAIEAMMSLRDVVMAEPGYGNVILFDALTRASAIGLAMEIDSELADNGQYLAFLGRLSVSNVSLVVWNDVFTTELRLSTSSVYAPTNGSGEGSVLLQAWNQLSRDDDVGFPANVMKSNSLDLLDSRDVALLLRRCMQTDVLVKTVVLAAGLKQKTGGKVTDLTEERLAELIPAPLPRTRDVMTRDGRLISLPATESVGELSSGERFFQLQVSYPEVWRLLQDIRTGRICGQLYVRSVDL